LFYTLPHRGRQRRLPLMSIVIAQFQKKPNLLFFLGLVGARSSKTVAQAKERDFAEIGAELHFPDVCKGQILHDIQKVHMKSDQRRYLLNEVKIRGQRGQELSHELRPDRIVVIGRDFSVSVFCHRRLADIVEQRSPQKDGGVFAFAFAFCGLIHNQHRMVPDIPLWMVDRRLLGRPQRKQQLEGILFEFRLCADAFEVAGRGVVQKQMASDLPVKRLCGHWFWLPDSLFFDMISPHAYYCPPKENHAFYEMVL
jgi:hypothetical protein